MAGELPNIQQPLQEASPGAIQRREPAQNRDLQQAARIPSQETLRK